LALLTSSVKIDSPLKYLALDYLQNRFQKGIDLRRVIFISYDEKKTGSAVLKMLNKVFGAE
jgi:hypothetical protein